ncbi:hypothetical protein BX600DRAFT_515146 [Xylariales sp. PMI_506]|nr:hypothetical protein BX600DRAFT_515146 [Xylariales sp. PMI_506]
MARIYDVGADDDKDDLYALIDAFIEKVIGSNAILKLASHHPEHKKWIVKWDTWKLLFGLMERSKYCNPDFFGMYIHKDFHAYGRMEMCENQLVEFNKYFKMKSRTEETVNRMWISVSGTVHWLLKEDLDPLMGIDDGYRLNEIAVLIGRAFLTTLNELDRANKFKSGSSIRDLALVMSLDLQWYGEMEGLPGDDDLDWPKQIVAYAKKAGFDFSSQGSYEDETGRRVITNRIIGLRRFSKYKKSIGKVGGEQYNIMKFSRKKRTGHALNGKDPFEKLFQLEIRSVGLMLY